MKTILLTRYHGPTNSRGSRISVRGFVPGRGIVRRTYSYDYSGRAHDIAAAQFLAEFYPGSSLEEVRTPEENQTGSAYIVKDSLPDVARIAILRRCEELRRDLEDCKEGIARKLGLPGRLEAWQTELEEELSNLEGMIQ